MADARTLDVAEARVIVEFFEGAAGFSWHRRAFLRGGPGQAQWVVGIPDGGVVFADVVQRRVVPLGRMVPFPSQGG
eukprot:11217369-Lingulodinium_polyedra.AAC.1